MPQWLLLILLLQVLEGYIDQLQALPLGVRFAAFASFYIFERLTLTTEFLPIGFVLPFLSPVVRSFVASKCETTLQPINMYHHCSCHGRVALSLPSVKRCNSFVGLSTFASHEWFVFGVGPGQSGIPSVEDIYNAITLGSSGNWVQVFMEVRVTGDFAIEENRIWLCNLSLILNEDVIMVACPCWCKYSTRWR